MQAASVRMQRRGFMDVDGPRCVAEEQAVKVRPSAEEPTKVCSF